MITEEQYKEAIELREKFDKIVKSYHEQKQDNFKTEWDNFLKGEHVYKSDDLIYSSTDRCECGAGLAYPKGCGGFHEWSCSKLLLGEIKLDDESQKGLHVSYPFAFYEIKSENQPSAYGATTRP